MGTQTVHTICMQTADAVEKREGEFVMKLGGDNPRLNAVKLALGSVEFPMVQWTIEEEWSHLYFSEGYRLDAASSWLRIEEKSDSASKTLLIDIPLHLNPIVNIVPVGQNIYAVRTKYSHGLWIEGKRSILPAIYWGTVDVICSPFGRINLSKMHESRELEYISDNEFMMTFAYKEKLDINNLGYGFLYMPTIPSPVALCNILSYHMQFCISLGRYAVEYNALTNSAILMSKLYPEGSSSLTIKLFGSALAKLLGYFSSEHAMRFVKKTSGRQDDVGNFDMSSTTDAPLLLPSETFPGWMQVKLTPGWYSPAHRPMCTGSPLRIATEFESAFNHLFFSLPERIPRGHSTSHFIVFEDPTGIQHLCPVFAGRYNPDTFCTYVEKEMTRLASHTETNTQFSVSYDYDSKKFTFACEVKQNSTVVEANFSLLFNHAASINGEKLGFPNACLKGYNSYTSSEVHIPYMKWNGRHHLNQYKISEIGHQKRFMVESDSIASMTAVIKAYDDNSRELTLMTYVGQLPFANGLQPSDVVSLSPTTKSDMFEYSDDEDTWIAKEFLPCPLAPGIGKSGVVVQVSDIDQKRDTPYMNAMLVRVLVKSSPGLSSYIGKVLTISCNTEPFNMCFGVLPRSLPSRLLGFGTGAVQWGLNGSVACANNNMIPPFQATGTHNLDHPDYILLYIEEGKKNVGLQHTHKNMSTTPFAKLVLYPMFREERMLPRDTTLLGSEMLSTITLKFMNPDHTPYHFHNVEFSLSLNFIRVSES